MDLNLTLPDGSVVSPFQLEAHQLVPFCGNKIVQRMAGFISELQTTDLEMSTTVSFTLMQFVLTIIFLIVGIVGFLGNLATILVIIRTPTLHSQTNYLLANLAVSDLLLIVVGVPFDLFYLFRTVGAPAFVGYCEATSTSISWFTYASILTITTLSLERLVGICYPFCLKSRANPNIVIYAISSIWLISFIPSLLIGLQFKPVVKDLCGIKRQFENVGSCDYIGDGTLIFELILLITFVLPVLFILFCYARILRTLNAISETSVRDLKAHEPLNGNGNNSNNSFTKSGQLTVQARASGFKSQKAQRTVIKILGTVTAVFFICYLPYHVERLFVQYYKKGCDQNSICHWLYPLSGVLQYISASLNPIIYNMMSPQIQESVFFIVGSGWFKNKWKADQNGVNCKVITYGSPTAPTTRLTTFHNFSTNRQNRERTAKKLSGLTQLTSTF
ncbi:G-PROTEIN-RECEP-F1-2 domain-containing protein [Aphelenchoides bicaudatus]|nr:G-PROTEIN-RECEP-F1-2 domain-containing protein [Aphelenchoides bicaudatus]